MHDLHCSPTKIAAAVCAAAVMVLASAGPAGAQRLLDLPVDTVVRARPGSVTLLAEVSVPLGLRGAVCTGVAEADNQSSVHPGNDIIVRSGGSSELLDGVEDSPGEVTVLSDELTLGDTVIAELVMGPDGVFSGGLSVTLECIVETPTTSSTPTSSETTAPTTSEQVGPSTSVVVTTPIEQTTTSTSSTVPSTSTTTPGSASSTTTPSSSSSTSTAPTSTTSTTPTTPTSTTAVALQPGTSAPPTGQLPNTGPTDTANLLALAAILILGGTALVLVARGEPPRRAAGEHS